jgi:hypothetical protein
MSSLFQNQGRVDNIDTTQTNLDNTKYADYMLSNFNSSVPSTDYIQFATQQPAVSVNAMTNGHGLNGDVIDADSKLIIQNEQERPLEKLQLFQRPFTTVPFMGRGFSNPVLESRLLQGESTLQQKSVGTVTEESFAPYSLMPVDAEMQQHIQDPRYTVEEYALQGWVRGGSTTRD